MPHYNSYDSFKTKKSIEKKEKIKTKKFKKINEAVDSFVVEKSSDYGIVIETQFNEASVFYEDKIVQAKLRRDIFNPCNQIVFPGDEVILTKDNSEYIITNLIKRKTTLTRIKKDSTRNTDVGTNKIIAANINLAVIVVAAKEPPLHPKFIDRYLLVLENNKIDTVLCLNKCDLKTETEEKVLDIYKNIGVKVIETSAAHNIGIEELKSVLKGKQAIFVGNSGVGKSSLSNAIMESNEVKTGNVSEKNKRGRHTTTSSKYYVWDENSSIIDTPGIRSLDVSSLSPNEIQDYFLEFNDWKNNCKYSNCLHYNEPYESCSIKQGVKAGVINKNRYESYLRIMSGLLNHSDYEKILKDIF